MPQESSNPFRLPSRTLIALLVGAIGLFALTKVQFQDTRPPAPALAGYRHIPGELQDVEARLWEDPLGAVAAARTIEAPSHSQQAHSITRLVNSMNRGAARILVLGVFVSGAPYAENIEARRRMRFAVLAGLHRAGFTPEDPEHVGYFPIPPRSDDRDADSAAVYEWMVVDDTVPHYNSPVFALVLWLDQDAFRERQLANFQQLVDTLDPAGLPNIPPPSSDHPIPTRCGR